MTSPLLVTLAADDLRAIVLEGVAEALTGALPGAWLSLRQLSAEYGFSRESLASAARDGLNVHRGPKGRLMCRRADVEEWLSSRPWTPATTKRGSPGSADDTDAKIGAKLRLLEAVR